MPYGIPDDLWALMPPDAQWNAQTAVERARRSGGDIAAVKAQNFAMASQGQYTPEVSGQFAGAPIQFAQPASPADDGSYYDGSGSGSGAAVRQPLASSPEWLAYLNALGLEENQFRADIDRQRNLMRSAADQSILDLNPQYEQQRRGITGSLEGRGMLRSGEHLRKQAESRANQGRQVAGIQTGLAGNLGQLESQLANKLIDIGARKAQQELQLRTQGYY